MSWLHSLAAQSALSLLWCTGAARTTAIPPDAAEALHLVVMLINTQAVAVHMQGSPQGKGAA